MRHEYWVVRYVPDPVRGERVNVGVVAGAGTDWAFRRVSNLQRASRLGGSATVTSHFLLRIEQAIDKQLGHVDELFRIDDRERLSRGVIEDLRARMNNIVQISAPRTVLADNADDAAELAFELMIVDPGHEVRHRSRTLVVRRLQEAFDLEPTILSHVFRSQQAVVGEERTGIDIAVRAGVVRQLSQAWSFDVKNVQRVETQVHAWNFMMSRLRREGGTLRPRSGRSTSAGSATIPNDVDINVVIRAGSSEESGRQFRSARDGWRSLGIDVVDEADAESIVDEAKKLVGVVPAEASTP